MDYNGGRSYDSGNGDYPYSGKPPEYGYKNKFRDFLSDSDNKEILFVVSVIGAALIFHVILKYLYSTVISSSQTVLSLYQNNQYFSLSAEMLYSLVCVGFPFIVSFIVLSKSGLSSATVPFVKPLSGYETFFLVFAGVGICMTGNIVTSFIATYAGNIGIGFHSFDYMSALSSEAPDNLPLLLVTIIHTAVLPAFIEEIAIRGCLMQPLRKFGDIFAVVMSGLVFGLLHGNLTQAPFAFIAGCVLGIVCIYTESMWPNIIIHLLNNMVSVLQILAINNVSAKRSYLISSLIIYGLIAIGAVALLGFFYNKKSFSVFAKPARGRYKNKTLLFFLSPTMLLAIIYFAVELYSDIYIIQR